MSMRRKRLKRCLSFVADTSIKFLIRIHADSYSPGTRTMLITRSDDEHASETIEALP